MNIFQLGYIPGHRRERTLFALVDDFQDNLDEISTVSGCL